MGWQKELPAQNVKSQPWLLGRRPEDKPPKASSPACWILSVRCPGRWHLKETGWVTMDAAFLDAAVHACLHLLAE